MDFFTPGHLVVIAIVAVVVLVGWKKLPEMSRSLGRSLRIFKTEMKALDTEVADVTATVKARAVAEPAHPAPAGLTRPEPVEGQPATADVR